ncbi:MAG: molecular chaperone TorD family protein [Coriobacteriales bacterium]|jgi:TorA maturation chaperone TorD|nr:molecular chaperone TorD family protein [Coriobacteriales bacterium]
MADFSELIQLTEQRISTYGFLSRLYRKEVDEELLAELKKVRFPANTGNAAVDKGYRLIATFLGNVWDNTITELAIDYVRVFIGHGVDAFSAAYPFESVYTSEKRLLMQDARDEVLAIYRAAGLAKKSEWKEGEDHIALEMDYMQVLSQRTIEALQADDEDKAVEQLQLQLTFLNDHLYAWVGMLTTDMKRFAKTDLYQGLAWLTEGFLQTDQEFLSDLLSED